MFESASLCKGLFIPSERFAANVVASGNAWKGTYTRALISTAPCPPTDAARVAA